MAEIIVIAAVAENNIIGKGGKIPWHVPEDFKHFKNLTLGHPCIMGDVTYESLPIKPLPDRENIVLTLNKDYKAEGAKIFYSFEDALEYVKGKEKVFICGGASIYKQALKFADKLEITIIHQNPEGDTTFPSIDPEDWAVERCNMYIGYSFVTYKRRRNEQ